MKRLLLLFVLLSSVLTVHSQSAENIIAKKWLSVYQYELAELPKSALSEVDHIYRLSVEAGLPKQRIKALLYQSKFAISLEEEAQMKVIKQFQEEIKQVNIPERNILQSYLASLYIDYYSQNRWRINKRTQTDELMVSTDFRTWDAETLLRKATTLYENSLMAAEQLKATPIADYHTLLELEAHSDQYRPTLYDLLAHKLLDFYNDEAKNRELPASDVAIQYPALFTDFLETEVPSSNYFNPRIASIKLYQSLLSFHVEAKNVAAEVTLRIEILKYLRNQSAIINGDQVFENILIHLQETFASHEVSSLIEFELATFYFDKQNKKQAFVICEQAIAHYPESQGAEKCMLLKKKILSMELSLIAHQMVPTNHYSKLLVNYTNIDSLSFQIFTVPQEMSNVFVLLNSDSAKNHFLTYHQALHDFSQKLINPLDYRGHSTEILVPPLETGHYVVLARVLGKEAENTYAFSSFQVTQLALISSRLEDATRFQVVDRNTGNPIQGATIQFMKEPKKKAFEELTTDAKGFAIFTHKKEYFRNISLQIGHAKDSAYYQHIYIPQKYTPRTSKQKSRVTASVKLLTDRSIYRPGQEVFFKGILMQKEAEQLAVVAAEYVEVSLYNVNDEEVGFQRLKTNEYGSFAGSFPLPKNGLNGEYTIDADMDYEGDSEFYNEIMDNFENSTVRFNVEEYKRPTFEVVFEPNRASYHLNDSIISAGQAKAFSGAALSDAAVSYAVTRKTLYPIWYYSGYSRPMFDNDVQEIASGVAKTDSKGYFKINFKAIPPSDADPDTQPIFIYEITAQVTDVNGESRSNSTKIKLGFHCMEASLSMPDKIALKETAEINLKITNLSEEAIAAKGKLHFIKLESPKTLQLERPWPAPDLPIISKEQYKKLFPHESKTTFTNYQEWPAKDTLSSLSFDTKESTFLEITPAKNWPTGKYLAALSTTDSLGNKVTAKKYFDLSNPKLPKLAEPKLLHISTDKNTYKLGDKVVLSIGSASPDISVTIDIHKSQQIKETKIIHLSDEVKTIEIPVTQKDENGFAIFYQYVNFNTYSQSTLPISVSKEIPELNITTNTFRDKLLPGSDEMWSFNIVGERKKVAEAEVLASMYDASLDQFMPHQWNFRPISPQNYYAYNSSRAPGFNPSNFHVINLYRDYYQYPMPRYDHLNWFGFSFSGNNYLNRQYLNRLRSVLFTENMLTISTTHDKAKKEGFVYGRVTALNGDPLPGVNIIVKGSKRSVNSNIDGYYSIAAKAGESLLISFIGMESTEIKITNKNTINVALKSDIKQLSEILVTSNGIDQTNASIGYTLDAVADEELLDISPTYQLAGKAAGLSISNNGTPGAADRIVIKGNSSINGTEQALYVVDGKIASDMEISADEIASMEILKGAAATALYGARGVNGVIIITTKNGQAELNKMLSQVQARTDLKETAFFFPQLKTDEKGNISFQFTTPEALSRWKLQLLAHNKQLEVGYKSLQAVTQKDLMVTPNAPRFLRKGDELILSAKITNLSNAAVNGTIALVLTDGITGLAVDSAFANSNGQQSFNIAANNTTEVVWTIKVPEQYDALQYKVIATTGEFSDGEQNIIPILPNRQLMTESLPFTLRTAGSKSFTYQRLKENHSSSLQQHQLTFELTTNPIWYAIKAMPYLMEYPHECSEQIFSRYFANKLGTQIIAANPAIKTVFEQWKADGIFESKLEQNAELKSLLIQETPWLREAQSEAEQQQRIAILFDIEKMNKQFEASISKLAEMQLSNGGFPWFSGSDRANRPISQYIMMGFGQLQQLDSSTANKQTARILNEGLNYLDEQLQKDYQSLVSKNKQKVNALDLKAQHISALQVQLLFARSFFDAPIPDKAEKAYDYYSQQAKSYWKNFDLNPKAMIALLLYRMNIKQTAYQIFASIKEYSISSEEMGMYWKDNVIGYTWTQSPIETQALLLSLFHEVGPNAPNMSSQILQEDLENLRIWLLRQKQTNQWPTTKATAQAIHALVLYNEGSLTELDQVAITMGKTAIKLDSLTLGAGYIKKSWNAQEFDESMADITISKEKDGLAFGTVYWQYFETLDHITADVSGPLALTKKVFKVTRNTTGELLKELNDSTKLQLGDQVRIRIILKSDRRMEFLHMKDQRAAGLEPVDVISEYKWQDGLGYYQSTKDASTNFFFEKVEKGIYVFEYDLLVNNAGTFQNGVTTIESMYAPEFKSHSEGIKLDLIK